MTANRNRLLFDLCPDRVTDPVDRARWVQFVTNYNAASELLLAPAFPLQLDFELNAACNLRCRFCLHGQQTVKEQRLPWGIFRDAILEGQEHGLTSVKLNYINEPLLVRNLDEYIRFALDHGVLNVYFATNGILLTEEVGRRLIEAGLTKLLISIDAATPETYQRMRGSAKYDRVVENIKSFIRLRDSMGLRFPLVRVNFLLTAENEHEADAFEDLWAGDADMIGFQSQVAVPDSDDRTLADPGAPFGCSFPFKLMVIDRDGLVLPCCTFSGREMPVGEFSDLGIARAWNSPAMAELRRVHQERKYGAVPVCRHCIEGAAPEQLITIGRTHA